MSASKRIVILFWVLTIITGCKNGMGYLDREIQNYGYIPYTTPLEFSGPGTLVGGSPSSMQLIASPDTCFPDEIGGVKTDLRREDRTSLPKREYSFTVSGKLKVNLFNFLQMGNPTIHMGTNFSVVNSVSIEITGVHVEYLDSIKLTKFYRESITQSCKDYLEQVGFIIQALKADKMIFKFQNKAGQSIFFQTQNLQNIVDIDADVSWEIQNHTDLVITTPKYLGYQLGSLRANQNGMVLYRASKVSWGKYKFIPINIFKDNQDNKAPDGEMDANLPMAKLTHDNELDPYSYYLPMSYLSRSKAGKE